MTALFDFTFFSYGFTLIICGWFAGMVISFILSLMRGLSI